MLVNNVQVFILVGVVKWEKHVLNMMLNNLLFRGSIGSLEGIRISHPGRKSNTREIVHTLTSRIVVNSLT